MPDGRVDALVEAVAFELRCSALDGAALVFGTKRRALPLDGGDAWRELLRSGAATGSASSLELRLCPHLGCAAALAGRLRGAGWAVTESPIVVTVALSPSARA